MKYTKEQITGIGDSLVPCFDGYMPPKAAFNYNEKKLNNFIKKLKHHINTKYQINIKRHQKKLDKKLYNLLQKQENEIMEDISKTKENHNLQKIVQKDEKKHYIHNKNKKKK